MGGTDSTGIDELGPVDYLVVEFPPGARISPARWRRSWPIVRPEPSGYST